MQNEIKEQATEVASTEMPKTPALHMRLLVDQRDYIKRLATNRTINPTGEIGEMVSRGLALFFVAEPYREKNWIWQSPQANYTRVGNDRIPNPGWCAANYLLFDIEEQGVKFTASMIFATAKSIAAEAGGDRGMQMVLFSAFDWITTKLYPRHVYDIKHLPGRFQFEPGQLEHRAKLMAKL